MNNTTVAIILFLVFYICAELLVVSMEMNQDINIHVIITGVAILFVGAILILNSVLSQDTKDNYKEPVNQDFEPSLRSVCKGGKYMWQQDTPIAKACRAMYDNPEHEKTIRNPDASYMMGSPPYANFEFDPIINDNFEFVRCANK